ncbi:four helix bundle protein [Scytonema sp. NUACC21]
MPEIHDFKDLKIWHELYGMVQQIRKSAVSIPANIAEAYGRRSTAEYIRFLVDCSRVG